VFCALNSTLRRERRRLVAIALMVGLAGAVVTTHGVMNHDHMGGMGDALVMCLAVAETAVIAVGVAVAVGRALARWPRWLLAAPTLHAFAYVPAPQSVPPRAGPPQLQVFRL
jgi:hypothetical protein